MNERLKILFCSDGSAAADHALHFGALIAAATQAQTTILGVSENEKETDALLTALHAGLDYLKSRQLDAELITKSGRPVLEIVERAIASAYDLVIIGATRKGHSGPYWMSARAYRIIEDVEVPVLVVPAARATLHRIVVCSGTLAGSDRAVELAAAIAQPLGAQLDLVRVLAQAPAIYANLFELEEQPELLVQSNSSVGRALRRQRQIAASHRVTCEIHLRHGPVVPELLKELRRTDPDLVVAGSPPPPGGRLRQHVLGSVARELVNQADRPVLIVRQPAAGPRRLADWACRLLHRPQPQPKGATV